MSITHAEALRLIQLQADHTLQADKQNILKEHLAVCATCQAYAQKVNQTENILKRIMHQQWDLRPTPLSVTALIGKTYHSKNSSTLLLTRKALIGVTFVVFMMMGWKITATNPASSNATQFEVLPNPTPVTQTSEPATSAKSCIQIQYQVQDGDTLESIASHFATAKDDIVKLNYLTAETLKANTELLVPVCDTTPTSTLNPPTFTITPFLETITTTPG